MAPSSDRPVRIGLLTNEYPPNVYGGAGVHVEYLARELARLEGGANRVDVFSFGDHREDEGSLHVRGIPPGEEIPAPGHTSIGRP